MFVFPASPRFWCTLKPIYKTKRRKCSNLPKDISDRVQKASSWLGESLTEGGEDRFKPCEQLLHTKINTNIFHSNKSLERLPPLQTQPEDRKHQMQPSVQKSPVTTTQNAICESSFLHFPQPPPCELLVLDITVPCPKFQPTQTMLSCNYLLLSTHCYFRGRKDAFNLGEDIFSTSAKSKYTTICKITLISRVVTDIIQQALQYLFYCLFCFKPLFL